jgi:hypothetical protein
MIKKFLPSLLKLKESLQTGQRLDYQITSLTELLSKATEPFALSEMDERILNEIAPKLVTPLCIPLNLKLIEVIQHDSTEKILVYLSSLTSACQAKESAELWAKYKGSIPLPVVLKKRPLQILSDIANSLLLDEKQVRL